MTLKIQRLCENQRTRLCLSGELRGSQIAEARAEIEGTRQLTTLDIDEVDVVDLDGVRLLNECQARGIQVVNCSPYIREWMSQEKRIRRDQE